MAARLIRLGTVPSTSYLLTTRGRRTGRLHTNPVLIVRHDEERWLVAPYGEVAWVHNARAAGWVTLTRGNSSEELSITEVDARRAAPVLKRYLVAAPIVAPYFEARWRSPVEAFAAEAAQHPVFLLSSKGGARGGLGRTAGETR